MTLKSVVLPAPFGTEDGPPLAGRDVQGDVAHGVQAAEAPADLLEAEDRLGVLGCGASSVTFLLDHRVRDPAVRDDLDLALPRRLHLLAAGLLRPGAGSFS